MKFIIAPDKFKGSLMGDRFCCIVSKALSETFPDAELLEIPLADGGDGTLEVVKRHLDATIVRTTVHGPLFRPVEAGYLISKDKKTAFVEMAAASGHSLLDPAELNCMETTTLGTGELILDAIGNGAEQLFLGIGGSATNDGGMGAAHALGHRFLDGDGAELAPVGKNLGKIRRMILPKENPIKNVNVKVACDVANPFYGKNGAAHVYGPQKGASTAELRLLDDGLKNLAKVVRGDFGIDLQQIPGAGAAGGLGGGAVAFLNGTLVSGIAMIKELADFDTKIKGADWIITGEGKLDGQTASGKTIGGVLQSAKKLGIPVAAFCGGVSISLEEQQQLGLDYATSILKGIVDLTTAKENVEENLRFALTNFASVLRLQ